MDSSSWGDGLRRAPWSAAAMLLLGGAQACIEVPISTPAAPAANDGGATQDGQDALAQRPPTGRFDPAQDGATAGDRAATASTTAGEDAQPGIGADAGESTQTALTGAARPARGDFVISEIMADPSAIGDEEGEWIELYNRTQGTLELSGCALADGGAAEHAIRTPLAVPAGGYITIARSQQPGFMPDLVLAFSLANTGDTVALVCGGVEIDRVRYDSAFPRQSGASLSLDPDALDADRNDAASAWCLSSEPLGDDFGSPGAANPSCAGRGGEQSAESGASSEANSASKSSSSSSKSSSSASKGSTSASKGSSSSSKGSTSASKGSSRPPASSPRPPSSSSRPPASPPRPSPTKPGASGAPEPPMADDANQPRAREVVISEFLADPTAARDEDGEWIELYNPGTRAEVDLRGCTLEDGSASRHPIAESLRIPAGGYVTLGHDGGTGFTVDLPLSISLANTADSIALYCGTTLIDRVDYDSSFPITPGASTSLDPGSLLATRNDGASAWCASSSPLGSQFGTPGAPNEPCSSPSPTPAPAPPPPVAPDAPPELDAAVPPEPPPAPPDAAPQLDAAVPPDPPPDPTDAPPELDAAVPPDPLPVPPDAPPSLDAAVSPEPLPVEPEPLPVAPTDAGSQELPVPELATSRPQPPAAGGAAGDGAPPPSPADAGAAASSASAP